MRFQFLVFGATVLSSLIYASIIPSSSRNSQNILRINPSHFDDSINSPLTIAKRPSDHSFHSLYEGPKTPPSTPHRFQQAFRLESPKEDDLGTGTVTMCSTSGDLILVDFAVSGTVCAIGDDTLLLANELSKMILAVHPFVEEDVIEIEETVRLIDGNREVRSTLTLRLEDGMDEGPMTALMKLLVRTLEALFLEMGERGFGNLMMRGEFEEVRFEAWWSWYEFLEGVEMRCMD